MKDQNAGVVYVATGDDFIREAIRSSESARRQGLQTSIFCDNASVAKNNFDHVEEIDNPEKGFIDKIAPLSEAPFDKCLFLDTDTLVVEDIKDIFSLLDKYHICYCHAPVRMNGRIDIGGIPDAYTQPNTGVILYRNNNKLYDFFRSWLHRYRRHLNNYSPPPNDQPAFREALYDSDLREYILPPEYNLRLPFDFFIGGNESVKILHGDEQDIAMTESKLKRLDKRFLPRTSPLLETPGDIADRYSARNLSKALLASVKSKLLSWYGHE